MKRTCHCGKEFEAREADVKRGWAKACSKSCAATLRERKTGNYQKFLAKRDAAMEQEISPTFNNAHQYDNCEL